MEKVAIIGFGSHVEKKIIDAFNRLPNILIESIYVRDIDKYKSKAEKYGVNLKELSENVGKEVQWVYISTPISTHYELTRKYLEIGKNIICEKPLTSSSEQTKELFDLASNKGLKLHEVCMYKYHKQYKHLKKLVAENLDTLKSITTRFTIPHLDRNDVRYKKELGGGALLDVGYYPLSILVSLFGKPKDIKAVNFRENVNDVDLSGAAIFEYKSFYCIVEWGIGLPYSNEITVITENQVAKYERIFSKPETLQSKVQIQVGFDSYEVDIGTDDHFVNMFEEIILDESDISVTNIKSTIDVGKILSDLQKN